MTIKYFQVMLLLILFMFCFTGCRGENIVEPIRETNIASTEIFLSEEVTEQTEISQKTEEPQSNETNATSSPGDDMSELASLSGQVSLAEKRNEPLVTTIELRGKDTFWLYKIKTTDSAGRFEIHDIEPGDYELWVLITDEAKIIPGCDNVLVPNNQWHIGIKYQETATMFGDVSLQEAIKAAQNNRSSNLTPTGFYAVTPPYNSEIEPQKEIEIILTCK